MLSKLLKYDFKSIFKLWWIAAVSSLALSVVGGFCITVLRIERELPQVVNASAGTALGISIFSLFAFVIISSILIFVRYYKNFFTDEGYLTFTLPVKISSLINSKLITAVTTTIATLVVLGFNLFVMLGIGFKDVVFSVDFWNEFFKFIGEIIKETGLYFYLYIIEIIAMFVLFTLFSHLFLYCCITLAAVITKKARVITAIGIYYGVNCVVSFITQMLMLFGIPGIIQHMASLSEAQIYPIAVVVILCALVLEALICMLLYVLQYWMLDRRLNLA